MGFIPNQFQDTLAEPGIRITAKLDWPLLLLGGGGGSIGVEFDRYEVGVMGFAAPLNDFYRDIFSRTLKRSR